MIIAIDAVVSSILIAAGYVYTCYYLNGVHWKSRNTEVLRLRRNRILYLVFAALTTAVLICLFYTVYRMEVIQSIKLLCLVEILFPIGAIDFRLQKIPNQILLTAVIIRGVLYIPEFISSPATGFLILKDNLVGAAVIGIFFFLLFLVFKNSIGMGDIKLFAVMGLYQGLWGAVNSVFFSLVVSFVLSVGLLITRKKGRKDTIPFGPSILIGTAIAIGLAGM